MKLYVVTFSGSVVAVCTTPKIAKRIAKRLEYRPAVGIEVFDSDKKTDRPERLEW